MKFDQQRPTASQVLLLLLLLLMQQHLIAASEDDTMMNRDTGESAKPVSHLNNNNNNNNKNNNNNNNNNKLPMPLAHSRPRQIRGSWHAANHWCRTRDRGGLAQVLGESDASMLRLAARARRLYAAGCYWISLAATVTVDELRWLIDNPQHDDTGCLCVVANAAGRSGSRRSGSAAAAGASKPRLRLAKCSQRLPFLCQRPLPAPHRAVTAVVAPSVGQVKKPQRHPVKHHRPTAGATKPTPIELISDSEVNDSEDVDSQEDHGKIPKLIEGMGILNPWATTPATAASGKKPPSSSWGKSPEGKWTTATPAGSWHKKDDNLMAPSQRSEFVTLLVLYSIVGVVCVVLVALCLIRCLRDCCGGRSRVRYVKQVDEDDIPRFMPSSWA